MKFRGGFLRFVRIRDLICVSGSNSTLALLTASLILTPAVGFAKTKKRPTDSQLATIQFHQTLNDFAAQQRRSGNPLVGMVEFMSEIVTDRVAEQVSKDAFEMPLYRDQIADQALDVLIREKGKYPILIGEPGVGKTAIGELMAYKIVAEDFPAVPAYHNALQNAAILRVSARNFLPGGTDINAYLGTVQFIAENTKRPMIVMLYESHFLNDYSVSVLREFADKQVGLPIILETDSKSYGNTIKAHPSFVSIAKPLMVTGMKAAEVKALLKERALPKLEARFGVKIRPEVLSTLVALAEDFAKETAEPRRSLYLAEEFIIDWKRISAPGQNPTKADLYRFIAKSARLPVIPQNEAEFSSYMDELRVRIKKRVIAQDLIVDGLVDQFQAALMSKTRQHSVALIMGSTGVGKTLSAEVLAEEFFQDKSRILTLDMTQFGNTSGLSTLFGAAAGLISSDRDKGVVCEFLDGRGQGGSVIILNEIEEAHSEVITRLMELFDKGEVRCGDGKVRYLGRSLIVMTSNKNTDKIMAYDSIQGMKPEELKRRLSGISQEQLKKAFTEKASYTQSDAKVVKPAVLERVDRMYFAAPLLHQDAVKVAQLEIDKYVSAHNAQSGTKLVVEPSVAEILTGAFYNESLGARQLRTAVQQSLSTALSEFKKTYGFNSRQLKVSAQLHPSQKTVSFVTIEGSRRGESVTVAGPKVAVRNKMLDPEFRERLVRLEDNLKSEVFGQDEIIHAIASAIQARFVRGGKENVVAGFMLGSTGAGKSQLAKSLAKFLYGRSEAHALFEMGRVQTKHDLANIFAPAKGIIGSDEPAQLEKFLIAQPEGGVLLFDEMSNAGGNDLGIKDLVAKQFYTMMQEGTYTSPSGKVYDLSNFIIIMTGNDGEELFKGLSSDSLLEETYKQVTKNPGLVRELLRKAGFSDAFVGRLSFAELMRPTLSPTKVLIANKMIGQWRAMVEKEQPFDIVYDADFVREVGLLMFSPASGARSIDHFISSALGPAVAGEALKLDWEELIRTGSRARIELSVQIDQAKLPFYPEKPYENKAVIQVRALQDGRLLSENEIDFSKRAHFMPQVSIDSALATAYHEMGHIVAMFPEATGKKAVKVTIVPEKIGEDLNALGYAQHRRVPAKLEPNHEYLVKNIAGLLAGSEAEMILGRARTVGRSNDVDRVGGMARQMIINGHLLPGLDAVKAYANDKGELQVVNLPEKLRKSFDAYVQMVIEEGRQLAIKTLKENWHVVSAGAELLMRQGHLSETEIERLLAAGELAMSEAPWYKRALLKRGQKASWLVLPMDIDAIPDANQKQIMTSTDTDRTNPGRPSGVTIRDGGGRIDCEGLLGHEK